MPAFVKNPKFIIGTIVVLWVAYVIWANIQPQPVDFHLLPFGVVLQFKLSTVIIGSALFGAVVTIVIHWLWVRPSNSSSSATTPMPPPSPSTPRSSTVA